MFGMLGYNECGVCSVLRLSNVFDQCPAVGQQSHPRSVVLLLVPFSVHDMEPLTDAGVQSF